MKCFKVSLLSTPRIRIDGVVTSVQKDKIAIENVQKRATKLVKCVSRLPYSERLRALGLPTLEYRRERADVTQVYKIIHEIDKIDKNKLFTMSDNIAARGHSLKQFNSNVDQDYKSE